MDKPACPFPVLANGERFEFESISENKRFQKIEFTKKLKLTF
jgi:hypothetical protein